MEARNKLEAFLKAWKDRDFSAMMDTCQMTWAYTKSEEDLKQHFGSEDWLIKSYSITSFSNVSNVKKSFTMELTFSDGRIQRHAAVVICESDPYKPAPFGAWGVNPVSVIRNFGTIKAKTTKKAKNESKK